MVEKSNSLKKQNSLLETNKVALYCFIGADLLIIFYILFVVYPDIPTYFDHSLQMLPIDDSSSALSSEALQEMKESTLGIVKSILSLFIPLFALFHLTHYYFFFIKSKLWPLYYLKVLSYSGFLLSSISVFFIFTKFTLGQSLLLPLPILYFITSKTIKNFQIERKLVQKL